MEDQLMLLQLLRTMLQAIDGIRICHTATSQAEALAICRQDPPDLLILDLALPDGSGLAVAEQLAELRPEAQLIVLSGQASSFICPTALQPMVRGVVDKTSAFRQLQEAIGQRDYPVVQGIVVVVAALVVAVSVLVDLLVALLDPRVQF